MTHHDVPKPDFATLTETPEFAALLAEIEARRDEFHEKRHIPRDVIALMKKARIFRSGTPTRFGGDAMAPHHFLKMVDKIGTVDGSAAWVAAFGSANTYTAALPEEAQRIQYADGPDQVFAGGLYPLAPADRVEGGWKVSGRWKFASGCMGADWIGVGIYDRANPPGPGAAAVPLMAVAPATEVEIIETWDTMGMQATGSHDTTVTDKFYPDVWTCDRGAPGIFPEDTLYRYPALAFQAQVHAACSLGLARGAIDLALKHSGGAKLMPGAPRLADRAYFQTGVAEAEAKLRSARSWYYEAAEAAWDVLEKGDEVPRDMHLDLRLSASHAARASLEAIQTCQRIIGMVGIATPNRMHRMLRDAIVVTQHAALNDWTFEKSGQMLCGLPAPASFP